jgi:hypothetical protein
MSEDVEARIASLEANRVKDAARIRYLEKWHDTVRSPLYKRVVWWLMGFRFSSLGTWYRARWNEVGWQYDE